MDTKLILFQPCIPMSPVSSLQLAMDMYSAHLQVASSHYHRNSGVMHDLGHYDNLVHYGGQDLWRTGSLEDRVYGGQGHYQISQMFPPYNINLSHHISSPGNNSVPSLCPYVNIDI